MMPNTLTFYLRFAVINFIVLTVLGLVLRYIHVGSIGPVNYQFLLHSHSHFAFAGWMFFAIALLITNLIHKNGLPPAFKWVMILALVGAYGMLVSFYLQGYKAVSITFSTLFIVVTYRFTYLVFKNRALKDSINQLSYLLIKAALIFLCVSSIGPFALGPLMATGLKNTPFYQDAIYIYLHFQMNGFMLLAVWGLFTAAFPIGLLTKTNKAWLSLFIYSTVLLYFIFTLWSRAGIALQIFAAIGAAVNLVSWLGLYSGFRNKISYCSPLAKAAFIATSLKVIFQVLVCYPAVGSWTFSNRDLIIGYIHLLTLGIITPLIFDQMIQRGFMKLWPPAASIYIGAAVTYLVLLFTEPLLAQFGLLIPGYEVFLFIVSLMFLVTGIAFCIKVSADAERKQSMQSPVAKIKMYHG